MNKAVSNNSAINDMTGESLKKSHLLESSSDILNMEEGSSIIGRGNSLDYSKVRPNIFIYFLLRGFSSSDTYMCWKSIFVRESGFGRLQTLLYLHSSTNAPSHKFYCTNKFEKGVNGRCASQKFSTFIISPLDMHSLTDDGSQNHYIYEMNPQKIH